MTRVYWDSMLFIYLLEEHPVYAARVRHILQQMELRGHRLCTSVFTLGEVLAGFYSQGLEQEALLVRARLAAPLVELLPFGAAEADRFARLRSAAKIAPADAIHLATAAGAGARLFLTNDLALTRKVVDGIDFIATLDAGIY